MLVVVLLLAGCGGGKPLATSTGATTTSCRSAATTRALAKLRRDVAAVKAAGRIRVKNRLLGGPALNHATDRFLHDLATAPISNLMRNRLIDPAAESAVSYCEQCFQALEAERPIPSIAHEGNGANC